MRVLVPEVERAVRAGRAEGAVDGVEGDGVYGVGADGVVCGWGAVAFECEVETRVGLLGRCGEGSSGGLNTSCLSVI